MSTLSDLVLVIEYLVRQKTLPPHEYAAMERLREHAAKTSHQLKPDTVTTGQIIEDHLTKPIKLDPDRYMLHTAPYANQGQVTFKGIPITRPDGSPLQAGDLVQGNSYVIDTQTGRLLHL